MNVYEPLQPITCAGALEILERGDSDELLLLPLRIGEFISDWKTAQNLCLRLCRNDNPAIRANAVLGLSYIARTCGKLDRELVEPVLTGELKDNETFRWRIMDAIDDINPKFPVVFGNYSLKGVASDYSFFLIISAFFEHYLFQY